MKRFLQLEYFSPGMVPAGVLVASVVLGAMAIFGFLVVPGGVLRSTDIRLEPLTQRVTTGSEFVVMLTIESAEPVNAFEAHLRFSPETLEVANIAYEDSIVDLWVERPQYRNDHGTVDLIGGTTQEGGFTGKGNLLTITFRAKDTGNAAVVIEKAVALRHDGLGTEAPLEEPQIASYIIERLDAGEDNAITRTTLAGTYTVSPEPPPSPDLNEDGRYSIADISILMRHLGSSNERYDLNRDTKVNLGDLSLLMQKVGE